MFTVKFPRLSHTTSYRVCLVSQEKGLVLRAQLYHGCPLVSISDCGVYDLIYFQREGVEVIFAPDLDAIVFEFEDFPGKRYDVSLTETWKPRTLYFI
jgi:hypothetical protein